MAPIALQLEGQILTSSTRLDGLEGKSLVRGAQEAQSIQKRYLDAHPKVWQRHGTR